MKNTKSSKQGFYSAVACYTLWGMFPIYWYPLNHSIMPAEQILAQRIIWSVVFSLLLMILLKQGKSVIMAFRNSKILSIFMLSALLIGTNWSTYLWAIVNNHVLEASLGYFITPLFSILLGRLVLKEPLNHIQTIAIISASTGILWLAIPTGTFPWVAILLTISFGGYGLVRKMAPVDALSGLVLETLLMLPVAIIYLLWCYWNNNLVFNELNILQISVLLGSGIATTLPLLLFAAGARRITLSLLGILQYISPTLQMIIGLLLFNETFSTHTLIGYIWVWLAVCVFLYGVWQQHKKVSV